MFRRLLLIFCVLLSPQYAHAVEPPPQWNTLKTEHFQIHFISGQQNTARRLAAIAESTHNRLSAWINWVPDEPTHVVLSDQSDLSNGFAGPIPFNRTVLYLTPPTGINSLEDYHDWLALLFTHEYVHILHLDKVDGLPADVRDILGRFFLVFPNAIQPLWLVEGLAVWHETDSNIGVGRGQSRYFEMMMREEYASGLKPVEQINQFVRSWPDGDIPYLYGGYFLLFLEEQYGEPAIKQWVENYSDNLIPVRVNSTATQATGKSLPALWDEFGEWLKKRFEQPRMLGDALPNTEGTALTGHGYRIGAIEAGTENTLYYVRQDQLLHTALMRWETPEVTQELVDLNNGAVIDVRSGEDVLIAQPEVCNNVSVYYDLFRYTYSDGLQRLTHCARYVRARWHPSDDTIAAVHVEGGNTSLHLLNEKGERQRELWRGARGEVLGDFDWSPDGRHIVAAIWRPELGWNIEEYDVIWQTWNALTASPLIESSPGYSPDGKHIYFSAEYADVYNIWRYSREDTTFSLMTNVSTGAFEPAVSEDNALYYIGYHAGGFDVYRLDGAESLLSLDFPPEVESMPAPSDETYAGGEVEPYSPLDSLRPRWWFPHVSFSDDANEIGIITGGNDVLVRHSYAATLGVDIDNDYPIGSVAYSYKPTNWVSLQAAALSSTDVTRDNNDNVARIRREDQIHLSAFFPFNGIARSWGVLAGLVTEYESEQFTAQGQARFDSFRDNIAGLGAIYSDTDMQLRSISESDGRVVRVSAENSDVFDSDFSGNVYTLDWREFVRLGNTENVFGFRYLRGYGTGNPRPFELGGIVSDTVLDVLSETRGEPLLNRREYEFRGYNNAAPGLIGRRMQMLSAEWRFPIRTVERGLMSPPVGVSRISGRAFVENAAAWRGSGPDDTFTSAGFEFHFDANALYFNDLRIRAGFAHGFDDTIGEDEIYLSIRGGF